MKRERFQRMANKIIIFTFIFYIFHQMPLKTVYAEIEEAQALADINAEGWIIIDSESGEMYAGKNEDHKYFPASITKIVTAMLAMERSDPDEVVTVSQTAADTIGSSLNLEPGDQVNLKDMLYGILLHSGNDGAVAIGERVSGNESDFAKQMTGFVKNLGARNTNFTNASGLPDENHYTTAEDMAIITRYAMKTNLFREMVSTKSYPWNAELWRKDLADHEKIEAKQYNIPWDDSPLVINHNQFLYEYEGAIGIKNGFTHESRYTLVAAAKRGDTELIGVILKSQNGNTAYQDMTYLMDYGFALAEEKEIRVEEVIENPATPETSKFPNEDTPTDASEPTSLPVKQESELKAMVKPKIPFLWISLGLLLIGVTSYFLLRRIRVNQRQD